MTFRLLQRIGVVLTLVLAALLLGADAPEYPGMTQAGMRALSRGVLPLVIVAGFNFAALDARRAIRVLALIVNVAFLGAMTRIAGAGAPPFVWMGIAVAALLVTASAGRVHSRPS